MLDQRLSAVWKDHINTMIIPIPLDVRIYAMGMSCQGINLTGRYSSQESLLGIGRAHVAAVALPGILHDQKARSPREHGLVPQSPISTILSGTEY